MHNIGAGNGSSAAIGTGGGASGIGSNGAGIKGADNGSTGAATTVWEGVRTWKTNTKKMQSVWKESLGKQIRPTCKDCGTGAVMESSGVPDTASASVVAPLRWYLHFEAILPQITKVPLASLFPFVLM